MASLTAVDGAVRVLVRVLGTMIGVMPTTIEAGGKMSSVTRMIIILGVKTGVKVEVLRSPIVIVEKADLEMYPGVLELSDPEVGAQAIIDEAETWKTIDALIAEVC